MFSGRFRGCWACFGISRGVCAPLREVRIFGIVWRFLLRVAGEFLRQGRRERPKAYM